MPMMALRVAQPTLLVDIGRIAELRGLTCDERVLRAGALTRHAELLSSPLVYASVPLLSLALPHVAHAAIRNRGTLGGSLALADPAAELPACALALAILASWRWHASPRTSLRSASHALLALATGHWALLALLSVANTLS